MDENDGGIGKNRVTVLFLDVRNFTLLLDNYGKSEIGDMLDILFSHVRDVVRTHGGEIDKLVGDGAMVVFRGESSEQDAMHAATEIADTATAEVTDTRNVQTVNLGMGIATGRADRTTIAEIDSTIIGRCVNVAARLEGLCKEYDVSILTDERTYANGSLHDLPNGYITRRLPDQNLRGIRQNIDIYHLCDTHTFSEKYISLFNRGVEEYVDKNYERALNAFTEAYTLDERYSDQELLNHFTNSCLSRIDSDRALFRNPDRYDEHSTIQEQQSIELLGYINQTLIGRDFEPTRILDVGCGTGKVTQRLATNFPDASVVGIDPSRSAIAKARTDHSPEDLDIEYKHEKVENYCPEEERGTYDLIFSNTAMHWVVDQQEGYENLRELIADNGVLAIHQGHEGTYKELHQVTLDVLHDFDYDSYFDNLNPPLDLIYYTTEEMEDLLEHNDFETIAMKKEDGTAPDTIVEDFAEASLNAYCDRLESQSQREVFREQFKRRAEEQFDPNDITVRRLYVVAEPATE